MFSNICHLFVPYIYQYTTFYCKFASLPSMCRSTIEQSQRNNDGKLAKMWHIGIHMDRVKGERGWDWAHAGSYHQTPVIFLGKITEKHSNWSWWNWWKLATGILSVEFCFKNPDYVDQLNPQQKKVIVICKIYLQFSLKWVFLVLVLILFWILQEYMTLLTKVNICM